MSKGKSSKVNLQKESKKDKNISNSKLDTEKTGVKSKVKDTSKSKSKPK
jgi:hypothetical protein